ncbi:MAG: hypothetical protein WBF17_15400 [Phycisphaerae bacterium]
MGLILLGVVIYLAMVGSYYHDISPEGVGIRELADAVGIETVRKCEENGSVYYLAIGGTPPGYVLASGPPVYVFDKHGALLEWIEDSGDQPGAMARWDMQSCQVITIEQALKEIRELASAAPVAESRERESAAGSDAGSSGAAEKVGQANPCPAR